jgi:DNA-binding NtrC family response regulator
MSGKVLIVDDERDFLGTWARLLNRTGYVCMTAESVSSALPLIDVERPDLVITDLNFPIGNGFEIVRHVRAKFPQTPVIIITAYQTPSTEQAATSAGAVDYLAKPFSVAVFADAVARALGKPAA